MSKTPKERYKENPEAYRDASKRWRSKNPEKLKEYKRQKYQVDRQNPEFIAKRQERWKRWYYEHRKHETVKSALNYIRRKYKVSKEEAERLMNRRQDGCQVCGSKVRTAIDHCHKTGRLRGFLCQDCNMAIGRAKDDPAILEALANYLRACHLNPI